MKIVTPPRPNFSRYAKLCDQTFYLDPSHGIITPRKSLPVNCESPSSTTNPTLHTSAFTSVSREKRGNFRFPLKFTKGQFTQKPNFEFGMHKAPQWSFSKKERYGKNVIVEYQICKKCDLTGVAKDSKMNLSMTSIKNAMKIQVKHGRSTSYLSTNQVSNSSARNYSIVDPRSTSPVSFFHKTKISNPQYLTATDLNNLEGKIEHNHYQRDLEPCPKGYQSFYMKKGRRPNKVAKMFEQVEDTNDERLFNNYKLKEYPTKPLHHIDFDQHLDRPEGDTKRLGPNTDTYSINYTRINESPIHLDFSTFRNKIKTRYDRASPEPHTRLDYDLPKDQVQSGLIEMNRTKDRESNLWPVVDPIIKKAGDHQMKVELKSMIPAPEINEAHRPKNIQKYGLMLRKDENPQI